MHSSFANIGHFLRNINPHTSNILQTDQGANDTVPIDATGRDTAMEDQVPNPNPFIVEPPTMNVLPFNEEDHAIKAFLDRPLGALPNIHYYDSVNTLESINDWVDLQLRNKRMINLHFIDDTDKIIKMGKETFEEIHKSVTEKTVASLFVLAYNARDRDGVRLFGDVPPELIDEENSLDVEAIVPKVCVDITSGERFSIKKDYDRDRKELVRDGFCFIAASYMRMFTKTALNYSKIGNHLMQRFSHFYSADFPFEEFHPSGEAASAIKSTFDLSTLAKNTFYALLYAGESVDTGRNIKSFLYVTHTAYTGLHPLVLFLKCMKAIKISSGKLALVLHSNAFEQELQMICHVIEKLIDSKEPEKKLQLWRFGRIFEDKFLTVLQTKNCKELTLVLAHLVKQVAPEENENIMSITQIRDASNIMKKQTYAYALLTYKLIYRDRWTGAFAGLEDVR